jgi:hypothetical protein
MTKRAQELASQIVELQIELDREIDKRRQEFGWRIEKGLVEFDPEIVSKHRRLRVGVLGYALQRSAREGITAPVIYLCIVPLVLGDIWASVYQLVCFWAYGIPEVERSKYFAFDAKRLDYLNWLEKLNCMYCAYANGVIAYVREIASRTEQYWCPIKHAVKISDPHYRYYSFLEYGDAEGYRGRLAEFQRKVRSNTA